MDYVCEYISPLGSILLTSDKTALTGLWFEGEKYLPAEINLNQSMTPNLTIFDKTKKWLDNYFAGEKPSLIELSLNPKGTAFQHQVWQILMQIPYGQTICYSHIAKQIASQKQIKQMSSQAVGGAVGHNPISIIIPCHRVIGINGHLTGYAGGINKKIALLQIEEIKINHQQQKVIV